MPAHLTWLRYKTLLQLQNQYTQPAQSEDDRQNIMISWEVR